VNKDIKSISEAYTNLGINNTERNEDSYMYAPKDYSEVRAEGEEAIVMQKDVARELNDLAKRSSRGLKEDYIYIASSLKSVLDKVTKLINKV